MASSSSLDVSKFAPLPGFVFLRCVNLDAGLAGGEGLPACDTLRLVVAAASTKPSSLAARKLALAALPSAVWELLSSTSFQVRFLCAFSVSVSAAVPPDDLLLLFPLISKCLN